MGIERLRIRFFYGLMLVIVALSMALLYQQVQIRNLRTELQQEQLRYKMLYRDPAVRDAIESGG